MLVIVVILPMISSEFDYLGDWSSKYKANIPKEVIECFGEEISPYGTERYIYEDGEIRKEVSVATLERRTLDHVHISSVGRHFMAFSMMSLDDEDPLITNAMLDTEVVVSESVELNACDNSTSYLDYAIFDDESITKIAIRNPSPGTVSRIENLKKRKSELEYVILVTEAFETTNYFKSVQERISAKHAVYRMDEFPKSRRKDFVMYVGLMGNDMFKIRREERNEFKDVRGWAVNPFSVFNSHLVNALVRTSDAYEFQYERKSWSKIERYMHDPKCFRYSAQASVKYIQDKTGTPYGYDKHQLVSHKFIPLEEGISTMGTREGYMDRTYIPDRGKLFEKRVYHSTFGYVNVYTKDEVIYDISLPFSFADRFKYIRDMNDQIPQDVIADLDKRVDHIVALPSDGYVNEGYVEGKGLPPEEFYFVRCMKYEFYSRDNRAVSFDKAQKLYVDGLTYDIPRVKDLFILVTRMETFLYMSLHDTFRMKENERARYVKCFVTKIEMPMCPRNGDDSFLVSCETSLPSPPYLDDNIIPVKKQAYPLHYLDRVRGRDVIEMPEFEMAII